MNDSPYKLAEETDRIIQGKLSEMGFFIEEVPVQMDLMKKIKLLNYLRAVRTSVELLEGELLKIPVK